jgi:membrane associated rhomboid family serine protease
MARGTEVFVVCKECGSEVSPYITECPYCGTRLRKRAPKLERPGRAAAARRRASPRLRRLQGGEIPGIRGETRPYATALLVALGAGVWVAWHSGAFSVSDLWLDGPVGSEWWRLLSTQFTYVSGLYAFGALIGVGLFGWLLERRHGPVVVIVLFLICGVGGALVEVGVSSDPVALGANGAALGLLAAWAVPDLLARRTREEYEGDLLGAGVIAGALLALPLARPDEANWVTGIAGAAIGLLAGAALARLRPT